MTMTSKHLWNADRVSGRVDRERLRAAAWNRDERLEKLAHLRDTQPDLYGHLGAVAHIALGHYEADKKNAAAHGRNVDEGN
ncbi:conserved hypothetical protein [Streptomyces sp. SPB78]|nr:hypothetical protein SSBG_01456 [Streptomyces sp. SPB074]EFK98159.1 conserved hypothetical protein [Streptomyces sp. SPB78]